jgi:hypothetical protein
LDTQFDLGQDDDSNDPINLGNLPSEGGPSVI